MPDFCPIYAETITNLCIVGSVLLDTTTSFMNLFLNSVAYINVGYVQHLLFHFEYIEHYLEYMCNKDPGTG